MPPVLIMVTCTQIIPAQAPAMHHIKFPSKVDKFCIKICSDSEYYLRTTSTCVTTCPSSYCGSDTTFMCGPCQDSLCVKCSGNSGETCNQCQDGAILDNDDFCKMCEAMDIEYIQSAD